MTFNFSEKRAPRRRFTCEYIRTFTTSSCRFYMRSAFLIKLRVVYYGAATLSRYRSTIKLFLKILFLRQLVFGTYSRKSLWWVLFMVNPLRANPTKWSNTLKQFVRNLTTRSWSVFDHFLKLTLKGLSCSLKTADL